jgi:transposase
MELKVRFESGSPQDPAPALSRQIFLCIPPRRIQELRELARALIHLKGEATRCRSFIHGLLAGRGFAVRREKGRGLSLGDRVRELDLPRPVRTAVESYLRLEEAALREVNAVRKQILKELRKDPEMKRVVGRLSTIPGVDFSSALLLAVELGDITCFRDPEHLAGHLGFVPSPSPMGGTSGNGRMTKQGYALLRRVLAADAGVAARTNPFFGRFHKRKKDRAGNSGAIEPLVRVLLRTIHRVWRSGKTYGEVYGEKP